jgi:hypothetical protein
MTERFFWTEQMWKTQQAIAYARRRVPAIAGFVDDCLAAFGVGIFVTFIGVLALDLLYSLVPPPIHVLGTALP